MLTPQMVPQSAGPARTWWGGARPNVQNALPVWSPARPTAGTAQGQLLNRYLAAPVPAASIAANVARKGKHGHACHCAP